MSSINELYAAASAALGGVLSETISLDRETALMLDLLGELARRSEVSALNPRERADLVTTATSVSPVLSQARDNLAVARERLRLAGGIRRRP